MDTTVQTFHSPTSVNGVYSVRCTEELLLPVFTDESVMFTMASPQLHLATSNSAPGGGRELRLVLLGRKGVGKSAVGQTILGERSGLESWRPTEECVRTQGSVGGTTLTVVDTPGWEWYYPLNSTPNWVRRETLRSVSLCPPGPHAVLLVVRACASVTEAYIGEIEEHLQPLGGGVWEHTMLLFTRGDELGLSSMEQRIQSSGPSLHRLLQKCGRRYHVMDNLNRGDRTQVHELIQKLELMMEEKEGGDHLEMDSSLLLGLEVDKERRARERRKKQRQMEAQTQRGTIRDVLTNDLPQEFGLDAHRSFSKSPRRLHEIRLVLLGERETGKSAAGNTILGKTGLFPAGTVTEECTSRQAEVTRRFVTVVDTPGWEGSVAGATPERVKTEIASSVALCPPGPHALLLTLRVDTLVRAAHVKEHLELLGGGVWRHVLLLFTHGDQLREGVDIQQHIQSGGRDLQWLLEKCRGRYHVISSVAGAGDEGGGRSTVTELLEKVEKVATMNRCEAFSNLVHEVKVLSRQRNQHFHQRLKEMGDKVLRQEVELRKVKEQEMKRLRWFLNRKKKVKSPGKVDLQREKEEEEEERRTGETKVDVGDLEERMRWLVEDREKEIQDLSLENERNLVTLKQIREEREKLMVRLELRERETEELKERIEEQQVKLLHLERSGAENQAVREEAGRWRKEVEKLKETLEQQEREIHGLTAEVDETKRCCDATLRRKEQEHDRELKKLQEEVQSETTGGLNLQHQEETVQKVGELEKLMEEKEKEMDVVKKKHGNEMKEQLLKHSEAKERQEQSENQMREKLLQSEKEILSNHNKHLEEKLQQKEKEMEQLKRQHGGEMWEKLEEMEKKRRENEESVKNLHRDFKKRIKEMLEVHQQEAAEKEKVFKELQKQLQQREEEMTAMEQKLLDQLEEQMLESEIEKEIMERNHQKQLEETLRTKEEEVEEKMEKLHRVVEGKEVEKMEVEKKYKDLEEEGRKETERAAETRRQLEEKHREIKELEQKFKDLTEEKSLQHQQEKELIRQCQEQLVQELQSRYAHQILQLKQEVEEERRGYKREVEAREGEVEEVRMKLKEVQEKNLHHQDDVKEIRRQLEEKEKETETMKETVRKVEEELQQRDEEIRELQRSKDEMETSLRDKDRDMEMKNVCLQQLQETVRQVEQEKQRDLTERGQLMRLEEERIQKKTEMEQQMEEKEEEILEMDRKIKEQEMEIKHLKEQAAARERRWKEEREEEEEKRKTEMKQLQEVQLLLEQRNMEMNKAEETSANCQREVEELREMWEHQKKMGEEEVMEKEEQLEELRRQDKENQSEIFQLKLTIEQTKSELKDLTTKMEKEAMSMIQEYEKEIQRRNKLVETTRKEKEEATRRLEVLQEQNEEVKKETETFRRLYEEVKKEEELKVQQVCSETLKNQLQQKMEVLTRREDEEKHQLRGDLETTESRKEDLLRREKEMCEREENHRRRELLFQSREAELDGREEKIDARRRDLLKLQENLEKEQQTEQEANKRDQEVQKKEEQIESLLLVLEGRQQELSFHGEDLQRKVKGLKDRELHLINQEQELLNWKAELQVRDDRIISTTRQLDQMGRDLTLLKEELRQKETKVKMFMEKLSRWQQNLEEREAQFQKKEEKSESVELDSRNDRRVEIRDQTLMYQEESGGGDGGRRTGESTTVRPGSDLRVMVLGETWSPRSPAGVTVLGGEDVRSNEDGAPFRTWRGQIGGRTVALVEPLGLRWRDGPEQICGGQRKSLLDSRSWCHPGPDVVLLLIPAFISCTQKYRTALEEQLRLIGEDAWQRTLLVITWGETLGVSAEQHILRSGELTRLVEKCGGRFHVLTNKKKTSQCEELLEKMEALTDRGQCL